MTPADIANMINDGRGVILKLVIILILSVALVVMFYVLLTKISDTTSLEEVTLPLLTIGGVIVLVLVLTVVASTFSLLGLGTPNQAMGLPEGSIRAVIALSLIVLFAILAVFLYEGVSIGQLNTIDNLSDADRIQFIKDHTTTRDLQAVVKRNADGTPTNLYTVTYHSANPTSDDFAKQLLVLLGTLMTAITSFYLGAGTATSAAAAAAAQPTEPSPTISGIEPKTHSISSDGATIRLQVMGANLKPISHVKIVRSGLEVMGISVSSTPTKVTCDIPVGTASTPPGAAWDVVVDDGAKSATWRAGLTITT